MRGMVLALPYINTPLHDLFVNRSALIRLDSHLVVVAESCGSCTRACAKAR